MSGEQKQQEQGTVDERIVSFKLKLPETDERLELPCSVTDNIFDIIEALKGLPSTSEYTSYELQINGEAINEETSISELVNEKQDTILADLVPSSYNEVSARMHLIYTRVYAGLETDADQIAEISGTAFGSSTYNKLDLNENFEPQSPEETKEENEDDKETKEEKSKTINLSDEEKAEITKIVSEICDLKKDLNIVAGSRTPVTSPALQSLFISQWTPSTNARRLAGDLFYLQAQTLEGEIFNITAHVSGFFVNNSTSSRFNGSLHQFPTKRSSMNYSLVALLKSLSPAFVKQIEKNTEAISNTDALLHSVQTTSTVNSPWLVEKVDTQTPDLGKSQSNLLYGGVDGSDLQNDWNKTYQLLKNLPHEKLSERVNREQSLISSSAEFNHAAIKGAMAIARGDLEPLNPDEDPAFFTYLRNGIFYSNAVDSIGQFKSTGGAEAARFAAGKDTVALKYLNKYDINGAYVLLTAVVDYCGKRIICQAPVPGLVENDVYVEETEDYVEEQQVKYGFIDDHSDVATTENFQKAFKEIGEAFHLKPHKIWNTDGSKVADVVTSGYTKGIEGTDKRLYAIDMFRTTPLDIEFIDENYDETKQDSYPHKEASLRHEAVSEWIKRETAIAVKRETEKLEKEGKLDDKQTIGVDDSIFLLNPDAFSLPAAPTPELAKELKSDEEQVREVSKFVNLILVPEFVKEMEKNEVYNAIDGVHLTSMLHEAGINVRYLGKVAKLALERKAEFSKEQKATIAEIEKINKEVTEEEEKEAEATKARVEAFTTKRKEAAEKGEALPDIKEFEEQEIKIREEKAKADSELTTKLNTIPVIALLDSLYTISVQEMIARATKHFLRKELANIPLALAPYVISHIHNCLLASKANPNPEAPKINPMLASIYKKVDLSILEKDPKTIIEAIKDEVYIRFRFALSQDWIDSINNVQLLRSIAIGFGIQWKNKQFAFTKEDLCAQIENEKKATEVSHHKYTKKDKKSTAVSNANIEISTTTFTPSDIICIVPRVKNSIFEATSISDAWNHGMLKLSSKEETESQEGFIFTNQSVNFCERLYGSVHNITATYLSKLAGLYLSFNSANEAVTLYKKAFQIFERCSGIDSYQSSLALNQLAMSLVSNNQIVDALKVYKRLLSYWILAFDETHPNVITLLSSISYILYNANMSADASKLTFKTLEISNKVNGELSQQSALFNQRMFEACFQEKKFNEAALYAEKAYNGYLLNLGLKDKTTVEIRNMFKNLKNYLQYLKSEAKTAHEKEQTAKKLEQEQHIKAKHNQKARQLTSNPDIANKSIDDIVAFISGSSSGKDKKKNNKKKNPKN